MAQARVPEAFEDHIRRLKSLAAEWRTKAGETGDPHYIELMTRTADELEERAHEIEHRLSHEAERRHASR